jgi:hypothetical protein
MVDDTCPPVGQTLTCVDVRCRDEELSGLHVLARDWRSVGVEGESAVGVPRSILTHGRPERTHAWRRDTRGGLVLVYPRVHAVAWRLQGIAQDALIMNLDDLLCVGVTDNILLSSTIGRNKNIISG